MNHIPDWTIDEFKTLLEGKGISPFNLAFQLPGRIPKTVSGIQQGVHAFHLGEAHSMLSKLMVDYLEERQGNLVCPVCGRKF